MIVAKLLAADGSMKGELCREKRESVCCTFRLCAVLNVRKREEFARYLQDVLPSRLVFGELKDKRDELT